MRFNGGQAPGTRIFGKDQVRSSTLPSPVHSMPQQAYIARTGPAAAPITESEWSAALRAVPGLRVSDRGVRGQARDTVLRLASGASPRVSLDGSGMVVAENPNEEVMELLFTLAHSLNANVCSARMRPYESLRDWERRSGRRRRQRSSSVSPVRWRSRRKRLIYAAVWLAALTLSLIVGLRTIGPRAVDCSTASAASEQCPNAPGEGAN